MKKFILRRLQFLKYIAMAFHFPITLLAIASVFSIVAWFLSATTFWYGIHLLDWVETLGEMMLMIAGLSFVYQSVILIIKRYYRRACQKEFLILPKILYVFKKGVTLVFVLMIINIVFSTFEINLQILSVVHKTIAVFIIGAITWVILNSLAVVETILHKKYMAIADKSHHKRKTGLYTKIHQLRNIANVIIVMLGMATGLMVFDSVRNVGISILASAGFLTAIVGLAAQKTLGTLFTGIHFIFTQPFEIGDVVTVENELGVIEEIKLSYVIIKLGDGRRFILPMTYFMDKPFQSWSHAHQGLFAPIFFYVDYSLPLLPLREALNRIVQESAYWDGREAKIQVSQCKETMMELRILVSTASPLHLGDFQMEVREKILDFIHQNYPMSFPSLRLKNVQKDTIYN